MVLGMKVCHPLSVNEHLCSIYIPSSSKPVASMSRTNLLKYTPLEQRKAVKSIVRDHRSIFVSVEVDEGEKSKEGGCSIIFSFVDLVSLAAFKGPRLSLIR